MPFPKSRIFCIPSYFFLFCFVFYSCCYLFAVDTVSLIFTIKKKSRDYDFFLFFFLLSFFRFYQFPIFIHWIYRFIAFPTSPSYFYTLNIFNFFFLFFLLLLLLSLLLLLLLLFYSLGIFYTNFNWWSFTGVSNSKSFQVSRTFLSIYGDLNNVVAWLISIYVFFEYFCIKAIINASESSFSFFS